MAQSSAPAAGAALLPMPLVIAMTAPTMSLTSAILMAHAQDLESAFHGVMRVGAASAATANLYAFMWPAATRSRRDHKEHRRLPMPVSSGRLRLTQNCFDAIEKGQQLGDHGTDTVLDRERRSAFAEQGVQRRCRLAHGCGAHAACRAHEVVGQRRDGRHVAGGQAIVEPLRILGMAAGEQTQDAFLRRLSPQHARKAALDVQSGHAGPTLPPFSGARLDLRLPQRVLQHWRSRRQPFGWHHPSAMAAPRCGRSR